MKITDKKIGTSFIGGPLHLHLQLLFSDNKVDKIGQQNMLYVGQVRDKEV